MHSLNIIRGAQVYTSIVFVNSYDANLISSSATDIMCTPTTDLTVNFKNYGNTNLISLDIEYSINGGSSVNHPWTGNLTSGASETVVIQSISVTPLISNSIDVTLVGPNGNTDQNITNNKTERKLLTIKDMLGRKTEARSNSILFYIYNDGTVEKKIIIE